MPGEVGLNDAKLAEFAARLGGDGCVVRDGYVVKTWGDVTRHKDWASAAKPVLSTLLLAAVADGKLASVDALVKDAGWRRNDKDAPMTYRHLANMVSGYSCRIAGHRLGLQRFRDSALCEIARASVWQVS